jgi:hypothetical protein
LYEVSLKAKTRRRGFRDGAEYQWAPFCGGMEARELSSPGTGGDQ